MPSANLHFVQAVAPALRLNGAGLLRDFNRSNLTKSSRIVNSLKLLLFF